MKGMHADVVPGQRDAESREFYKDLVAVLYEEECEGMNVPGIRGDVCNDEDADDARARLTAWATMVGKTFHGDGLALDAVTSLSDNSLRSVRKWTIAEHEHTRSDKRRKAWVSTVMLVGNRFHARCRASERRLHHGVAESSGDVVNAKGSVTAESLAEPLPALPTEIWIHIIKLLDVVSIPPPFPTCST